MGLYNTPSNPLLGPLGYFGSQDWLETLNAPKKRKAFFSFHFDDVMRVNAVRQAWRFRHPDTLLTPSFYDSSLWESRQREGDDSLKRLIREGVDPDTAGLLLNIHDALVLMVPDTDRGQELVCQAAQVARDMWSVWFPGVPGDVDVAPWSKAA